MDQKINEQFFLQVICKVTANAVRVPWNVVRAWTVSSLRMRKEQTAPEGDWCKHLLLHPSVSQSNLLGFQWSGYAIRSVSRLYADFIECEPAFCFVLLPGCSVTCAAPHRIL